MPRIARLLGGDLDIELAVGVRHAAAGDGELGRAGAVIGRLHEAAQVGAIVTVLAVGRVAQINPRRVMTRAGFRTDRRQLAQLAATASTAGKGESHASDDARLCQRDAVPARIQILATDLAARHILPAPVAQDIEINLAAQAIGKQKVQPVEFDATVEHNVQHRFVATGIRCPAGIGVAIPQPVKLVAVAVRTVGADTGDEIAAVGQFGDDPDVAHGVWPHTLRGGKGHGIATGDQRVRADRLDLPQPVAADRAGHTAAYGVAIQRACRRRPMFKSVQLIDQIGPAEIARPAVQVEGKSVVGRIVVADSTDGALFRRQRVFAHMHRRRLLVERE